MPVFPGIRDLLTGGMIVNDENKRAGQYECRRVEAVSDEDIKMIKKVHRILDAGKNVEIKKDPNGKPKILKVSKELA